MSQKSIIHNIWLIVKPLDRNLLILDWTVAYLNPQEADNADRGCQSAVLNR